MLIQTALPVTPRGPSGPPRVFLAPSAVEPGFPTAGWEGGSEKIPPARVKMALETKGATEYA